MYCFYKRTYNNLFPFFISVLPFFSSFSCTSLYLKKAVVIIIFFKRSAFCKVGWNHLIFHVGCSFFHGSFAVTHSLKVTLFIPEASCSHQFSHVLNKTDFFWLQLLIPRSYFYGTGTLSIQCSNGKSSSHPFFEGYCIYFKGDFPFIIVGEILSGRVSSKNVVLCSFRTNIIISTEHMQLSFLSTVLSTFLMLSFTAIYF